MSISSQNSSQYTVLNYDINELQQMQANLRNEFEQFKSYVHQSLLSPLKIDIKDEDINIIINIITDKIKNKIDLEIEKQLEELKIVKETREELKKSEKKILTRVNELESYIKNEKFHDLLLQLQQLEEKFQQEALQLVNNIAIGKNKK